jgi:hypothetical protein
VEDSLLGKPVYILDSNNLPAFEDSVKTPLFTLGLRYDSSLHSFAKIQFRSDDYATDEHDSLRLHFSTEVPEQYRQYLQKHSDVDERLAVVVFKVRDVVKIIEAPFTLQQVLRGSISTWSLSPSLPEGDYFFRFGVMSDGQIYTHNSEKIKLSVK